MDTSKIEIDINPDYTMMKQVNENLYLSQEQMDILDSFNINYREFTNLSSLILEVEEALEETGDEVLDNLLDVLEERNYYQNYNK